MRGLRWSSVSLPARSQVRATVCQVKVPDANPPMMPYSSEYSLVEVSTDYLLQAVKPKQFIHIDQSDCILCEGCVDICPWKCIHLVSTDAIVESSGTEMPGVDPSDGSIFVIDDDICTRCALCVDRCPTGVIVLGKLVPAPATGDPHVRTNNHGYAYGLRL
jgi:ferredoxin